ncbi:MAG: hypothetical protein ABSH41_10640, partial [Syntrophobacteraceae bacterium]
SRCFPDLLTLLDMPDLLLYFQKIMAERGLTYKVGFTGRLQTKRCKSRKESSAPYLLRWWMSFLCWMLKDVM